MSDFADVVTSCGYLVSLAAVGEIDIIAYIHVLSFGRMYAIIVHYYIVQITHTVF